VIAVLVLSSTSFASLPSAVSRKLTRLRHVFAERAPADRRRLAADRRLEDNLLSGRMLNAER